jgi:hypothetical protein
MLTKQEKLVKIINVLTVKPQNATPRLVLWTNPVIQHDLIEHLYGHVLDFTLGAADVDGMNVSLPLWLFERLKLTFDHGSLHVVTFPGSDALSKQLFGCAEVNEMHSNVMVVVPCNANYITIFSFESAAGKNDALGSRIERIDGLLS